MKKTDDILEELNGLSPFLAERKGAEEGFKVPKDYFRSLPDEVMKRVRPETPPIVGPLRNWLDEVAEFVQNLFQPRYVLAYASVAVFVALGIYFLKPDDPLETPAPQIAHLETEAIEEYLSENIDAISTDLLEAEFAGGGTSSLSGLEVEDMEEYLNSELDEISLDDLEDLL